jgi:hypothetical protein
LDDGEAQAVEGAASVGFVPFVAGGVAIADAEEAARAGEVEGDGVGGDGDGAAPSISFSLRVKKSTQYVILSIVTPRRF